MFGSVTSAQIAHLSCITEAQKIIGYTFRSPGYLFQALQAPGSGVIEIDGRYLARGNECIAIVGDRALGAVLSKDWFTAGWVIKGRSDELNLDLDADWIGKLTYQQLSGRGTTIVTCPTQVLRGNARSSIFGSVVRRVFFKPCNWRETRLMLRCWRLWLVPYFWTRRTV